MDVVDMTQLIKPEPRRYATSFDYGYAMGIYEFYTLGTPRENTGGYNPKMLEFSSGYITGFSKAEKTLESGVKALDNLAKEHKIEIAY
jgi:hypothetical protein